VFNTIGQNLEKTAG